MKYFVLEMSEDGDVYLRDFTKEELEQSLNQGDWEGTKVFKSIDEFDLMEAGAGIYIFKGELVTPVNEKVVTVQKLP